MKGLFLIEESGGVWISLDLIQTPRAEATGTPEIRPTAPVAPSTNLSWIIYVFIVLIIISGVYFFFYKRK